MNGVSGAYATRHGSITDVAQAIAQELQDGGASVDVRPLAEACEVLACDAVPVGAPMIIGWHRKAVRFLVEERRLTGRGGHPCLGERSGFPVGYLVMRAG